MTYKNIKLNKKIAATVLSIILVMSCVPLSVFVSAADIVSPQVNPSVSLYHAEVPVATSQITTSDPTITPKASDTVHSATGGSVTNGLAAYSDTTVGGMYTSPINPFYTNAAGINCTNVAPLTWEQMFGLTSTQLQELIKKYEPTTPTTYSQNAFASLNEKIKYNASDDTSENPVEQMLDFTLDLAIFSVKSNNPNYESLIDVATGATSMSDLLTDPAQHAGLVTVLAATSGTAPNEVDDTPIGELFLKTANNISPKENGEEYSDPVDFLLYKLEEQNGIIATRDTPIKQLIGDIIRADGEFDNDESTGAYPTVFWLEGEIDPARTLNIEFSWPSYSELVENIFVTFDNIQLSPSQLSIEGNDDVVDGESTVTLSGVFAQAGVHSIFINVYGAPMYIYLDLTDSNEPTTNSSSTTTNPPEPTSASPDNTDTPTSEATTISSTGNTDDVDIPRTGGTMIISGTVAATALSACAIYVSKRKRND